MGREPLPISLDTTASNISLNLSSSPKHFFFPRDAPEALQNLFAAIDRSSKWKTTSRLPMPKTLS